MGVEGTPRLKVGDKVRAVIEYEVTAVDQKGRDLWLPLPGTGVVYRLPPTAPYVTEFEVLTPPVVTFKPGDVVRHNGRTFYLAANGYAQVSPIPGGFHLYSDGAGPGQFNSEFYEKVELHEAPL